MAFLFFSPAFFNSLSAFCGPKLLLVNATERCSARLLGLGSSSLHVNSPQNVDGYSGNSVQTVESSLSRMATLLENRREWPLCRDGRYGEVGILHDTDSQPEVHVLSIKRVPTKKYCFFFFHFKWIERLATINWRRFVTILDFSVSPWKNWPLSRGWQLRTHFRGRCRGRKVAVGKNFKQDSMAGLSAGT